MRLYIPTTIAIMSAIVWFTACSKPAPQPSPKDDLVNVLTSPPGSVNLSPSQKYQLARYALDQIQALTNPPPRKP